MLIDLKRIQKNKYTPCVILAILTAGLLLFPATPGVVLTLLPVKFLALKL